ncbi:MAG: hypothetical protein KBA26_02035 [Candidatus Delongbacteria bacterium]|nr:hypothetical protein [Candidatus Delongbacteria bacterium]
MNNFLNYLKMLVAYRKRIMIIVSVTTLVTLAVSFILPKYYKSEAVIYPPIRENGISLPVGGLGALAGNLMQSGGFELPVLASPSDVWVTMLKSNAMAIHIINRCDLMNYYRTEKMNPTILAFKAGFFVEVGREGAIKISFEKKEDPEGAYRIISEVLQYLDTLNQQRTLTMASNRRIFVEKRLNDTKKELTLAEQRLNEFQKNHNLIEIPTQTQALISTAAGLISNITLYKTELTALNSQFSGRNSRQFELNLKLKETQNLLNQLYSSNDSALAESRFLPSFNQLPDLSLEYMRLYRDLKIQEVLFELLTSQYEQERINEVRNTPSIQVLDPPFVPDYKSRPKRMIIVIIAFLFSLLFSLFHIAWIEYRKWLIAHDPNVYNQLHDITTLLRHDFNFLWPWRRKK